jgi:putative hydrolase of the HAD superfamily
VTVKAILIDVGGVLLPDHLQAASADWGRRLGIGPEAFLAALFGGNDDRVLIGRTSEDAWWGVVAGRLGVAAALIGEIRRDLTARHVWDAALLDCLRGLRGRAAVAIVSNAWPDMRLRLAESGVLDLVDAVVLSCEIGCAKPDHRIYEVALRRLGAAAADALFIDDTAGHVDAARSLGMSGHRHIGTDETLDRIAEFAT